MNEVDEEMNFDANGKSTSLNSMGYLNPLAPSENVACWIHGNSFTWALLVPTMVLYRKGVEQVRFSHQKFILLYNCDIEQKTLTQNEQVNMKQPILRTMLLKSLNSNHTILSPFHAFSIAVFSRIAFVLTKSIDAIPRDQKARHRTMTTTDCLN